MRTMWDALYPDRIPQGIPTDILIATYVQACKRFPLNQIVSISSDGVANTQILDVERGAVDPSDRTTIVNWANRQAHPIIYCTRSNWNLVRSYFPASETPQWWESLWDGQETITPGSVGHQYVGSSNAIPAGAYDSSVMLDFIKGIDVTQPSTVIVDQSSVEAIARQVMASPISDGKGGSVALSQAITDLLTAQYAIAGQGTFTWSSSQPTPPGA